jgi:hypothetical protein
MDNDTYQRIQLMIKLTAPGLNEPWHPHPDGLAYQQSTHGTYNGADIKHIHTHRQDTSS